MLATIRQQCVRLAAAGMLCTVWAVGPAAGNSDRQIVDAAKERNWATVGILLDRGVDVDTPQGDGATALHWAAHWNDLRTVNRLIEAGANVDAANELGATPLWVACASRNTGVVQRLLAVGADANEGLLVGETVLMRCTATGDPAAVNALIEHGADIDATEPENGQTALMRAAAHRQPEATRMLLAHGAAVDRPPIRCAPGKTSAICSRRSCGSTSTAADSGQGNTACRPIIRWSISTDARPEIWAYGFRNPWKMSFDSRDRRALGGRCRLGTVGNDLPCRKRRQLRLEHHGRPTGGAPGRKARADSHLAADG